MLSMPPSKAAATIVFSLRNCQMQLGRGHVPHHFMELLSGQFAPCIPLLQDVKGGGLWAFHVLRVRHAVEKAADQEDYDDPEHGVRSRPE